MPRTTTLTVDVELESTTCYLCGIVFAFPADLMAKRRRDHETFYCPVGHSQAFIGKSKEERLEEELKAARLEIKRAEYRAQSERIDRERIEKQLTAARGQLTKARKRIANGVCPCCHRSFAQLQRHMATKHPEYAASEAT